MEGIKKALLKILSFISKLLFIVLIAALIPAMPSSSQIFKRASVSAPNTGKPVEWTMIPGKGSSGSTKISGTAGGNLLKNPGFELEKDGQLSCWGIYDWRNNERITELKFDDTVKRSGTGSAYISSLYDNDARIKQTVKVEQDTYYRISCWVMTKDVGNQNIGANISIEGLGSASRSIKGTNGKWEYIELIGKTGLSQRELPITLGVGGYSNLNKGSAWFDDVKVEKLDTLPAGKKSVDFSVEIKDSSGWLKDAANGIMLWFLILLALLLLCLAAFIIIFNILHVWKAKKIKTLDLNSGTWKKPAVNRKRLFDKKDVLIMSVMTLIYLAVALYNLGSTNVPKTSWTPVRKGENFTVDFGREVDMERIYFYFGLGNGKYNILAYGDPSAADETGDGTGDGSMSYGTGDGSMSYESETGDGENPASEESDNAHDYEYSDEYDEYGYGYDEYGYEFGYEEPIDFHTKSIEKSEFDEMFIWKYYEFDAEIRTLSLYADTLDSMIFEMGFFEKGSTEPIRDFTITSRMVEPHDSGIIENLFDEQHTIEYAPSYRTSTYFDEIYHARTAYEHLNKVSPYETTHPPLGKVIMAAGIRIFGMNPFGWRIMGTLLGALMIPFMYAFGMKLFKKRFYAICSAYLLSVDFMHFVQTRIATIDVYCVFFIILMYYFLYDYYIKKSYTLGYRKSLVPLFLSGLAFGLGAASKWVGIYAGAGLALIFIITKSLESRDYIKELRNEEGYAPAWLKRFVPFHINRTFLWSILFFAVIPAAIYILSYIPYLVLRNYDLRSILDNQIYMYKYHSKDVLDATHAYGSMWWS
ncbi:MAG: glycosyltransferase family 39 protein, partial [Eubacteriales bacterium]|nr:glycosyltransferase family 39 protein [Eubacteriales bacterium]